MISAGDSRYNFIYICLPHSFFKYLFIVSMETTNAVPTSDISHSLFQVLQFLLGSLDTQKLHHNFKCLIKYLFLITFICKDKQTKTIDTSI